MRLARGRAGTIAVWAPALNEAATGVGVLQRELYRRLPALGVTVDHPAPPPSRSLRSVRSLLRVVGPQYDAALVCATPAPIAIRVPFVMFVYDLRWRRTRGVLGRTYRYIDLRRTVSRAGHIFAISARTMDDLVELFPGTAPKCTVVHLGPGLVTPADFTDGQDGTVLLAGGAAHKRNELVAEALSRSRPSWAKHFLCVGVSEATRRTLAKAFGSSACEEFEAVDDATMRALFQRARVYISASMEEGFGLPMVEALAAGCQVIAIRQPLTTEVLGSAAVLLDDGDASLLARQLTDPAWVAPEIRRARAEMFGWENVAAEVAATLKRLSMP